MKHKITTGKTYQVTISYGGNDDGSYVDCWECSCGWKSSSLGRAASQEKLAHQVQAMWEEYSEEV